MSLMILTLPGCSLFVGKVTQDLAQNLSDAIRDNNDLKTVKEGSPAYLIMVDSLVRNDPDNPMLLKTAALLHATYAEIFVEENERAVKLTRKALDYALNACCAADREFCSLDEIDQELFEKKMEKVQKEDIPFLYTLGAAWAAWINARSSQMKALARIPRIELIMKTIVSLDEHYMDGGAHIFLGTIATILPPLLGGKPDLAREHFVRGIELSGSSNLMAKVSYARRYARLVYDRELHDKLLMEVLEASPDIPGYTLTNTLAQKQARVLLDSANDYF